VEVLWRGAFGMDAKRGAMGQGWPTVTTIGIAPERGKLSEAKPGCRARFLFGYFLFRASKEKVTRRKGETGCLSRYECCGDICLMCIAALYELASIFSAKAIVSSLKSKMTRASFFLG
jgi:hypothetical protein